MEQTNQKPKDSMRLKTFLAGLIKENPVLVGLLGMCPTLATTKSLESAFGMGILVILTLIGSNVLISLLRKIIPSEVKIPCYIVIIATFVTIIKMFAEAFLPELYQSLGVFISLIVVNCIILGRAEAFASKNGPLLSLLDALGMGIGFTMALCIMGVIREILGTGGLSFGIYFTFIPEVHITPLANYAIKLFVLPSGGFLTLGCILAVMAFYKNRKEAKKIALEKQRIEELKAKKAAELAAKAQAAAVETKKEEVK